MTLIKKTIKAIFIITLVTINLFFFNKCISKKKSDQLLLNVKKFDHTPRLFTVPTWDMSINSNKDLQIKTKAEWENTEIVLLSYPFDIPMNVIKELSENCKIKIIVNSKRIENTLIQELNEQRINIKNIELLESPSHPSLLHDLSFFTVYESGVKQYVSSLSAENCEANINKKNKYKKYNLLKIKNLISSNAVLSSNNVLVDGDHRMYVDFNIFKSNNNNNSLESFKRTLLYNLGIEELIYFPLINEDTYLTNYINILDSSRVILKKPVLNNSVLLQLEHLKGFLSVMNENKQVFVEWMQEYKISETVETSYLKSLIVNNKVFVPQFGINADAEALKRWKELMPNHIIIGVKEDKNQRPWTECDGLINRIKLIH